MTTRLLTIAFIFSTCANVATSKINDVRGVRITQVSPNISQQGQVLGYDTLYRNIYFYKDYRLYYLSYTYELIIQDSLITSESRNHYIFHKKGSTHGLDFDEYNDPKIRNIKMDSIYKTDWVFRTNLYSAFSNDSIITNLVSRSDSIGKLKEHYYVFAKSDTTWSANYYLEFTNKIKVLDFTLCKELDSIHKMKLQRMSIVNNPRFIKAANVYMDKIEVHWALAEIKDIDQTFIKKYFEMFKNR